MEAGYSNRAAVLLVLTLLADESTPKDTERNVLPYFKYLSMLLAAHFAWCDQALEEGTVGGNEG